jgi:hypothetical protein
MVQITNHNVLNHGSNCTVSLNWNLAVAGNTAEYGSQLEYKQIRRNQVLLMYGAPIEGGAHSHDEAADEVNT